MEKVLKTYLKRLTNLTGNNRSLSLLRLGLEQFVDIHDFNFLNGKSSFAIIAGLIARSKEIPLCAMVDSRDQDSNIMGRRLKKLERTERFLFEERGTRDLYIGWPFLRGKFSDGTVVRCPLMFFPVALELKQNQWSLRSKKEVNITLNKTFLLAYAFYNKVELGDELLERVFDDFDTDATVFRTALYQLFKESDVEINFNQENFEDELRSFAQFKKKDFEETHPVGELKLYPEAVLGIFPQSGSHLMPDYTALITGSPFVDMEDFFLHKNHTSVEDNEDFRSNNFTFLDKVEEERTFTPFKLDAFQENAIKAVKKGSSLVVQGPPGTGKSQLICNLISDFIARGKKVLLVCQKKAALDVVYERMVEKDLGDFMALVHDFKNDRKEIYDKIAQQVSNLPEFRQKNNALDTIQLERRFLQASRKIDQLTESLEEFRFALFDRSECGLSVKELYLRSEMGDETINLKQEYRFFHYDNVPEFLSKLKFYTDYAQRFDQREHALYNRKPFVDFALSDFQRMKEILEEVPRYQVDMMGKVKKVLNSELNLQECEAILEKKEAIEEMVDTLNDPEVYRYFQWMLNYPFRDADLLWLANTERVFMECYSGEEPEMTLSTEELGKFQSVLKRGMEARKGLVKWAKWKFLSSDKDLVDKAFEGNGLKPTVEGFKIMEEKVDNRLNLEHNITKLKKQAWLTDMPATFLQEDYQKWFRTQTAALKCKLTFGAARGFKDYFNVQKLEYIALKEKIQELLSLMKGIPDKKSDWYRYLSTTQVSNIIHDPSRAEKIKSALIQDFDAVCEFDMLRRDLKPHELSTMEKLFERVQDKDLEQGAPLFLHSLSFIWIEHIETKYPILRTVSSMKFQKMEAELQQAVKDKMEVSKEILLIKVREQTYENVSYNRLNNRVTYRELDHQVTKKRRIWPLRKLIAAYADELFQLMPCWMASPESVSAIFPMSGLFDLVIFDEASQCFAEKGIPSIYRGKQLVVTGDNMQLRPNDLYHVRYESEKEEEDPSLEVDSLLELSEQYLMSVQLRGHYRSKSLDLIDFSNQHFYKGKLRLLPDSHDINKKEPSISYVKVEGLWENNINDTEAHTVVNLALDLWEAQPEKSLGIVTFNAKQQGHIQDVLEAITIERKINPPRSLFVKNIENVQGDERDIILFSIGYAKSKGGKMMMQFGSLNALHGENRLNVAITRAREKIYVVSSILPQELHVEGSKNEGPKLLKAYLEYAFEVSQGHFRPSPYPSEQRESDSYLKTKIATCINTILPEYHANSELPFADLTIGQNGHYIGLIMTDDDIYYNSISSKEAHVYTPFTMQKKNWKYRMVFSREYWSDENRVKESLQRFVYHNKIDE